jgi:hypothetical protein
MQLSSLHALRSGYTCRSLMKTIHSLRICFALVFFPSGTNHHSFLVQLINQLWVKFQWTWFETKDSFLFRYNSGPACWSSAPAGIRFQNDLPNFICCYCILVRIRQGTKQLTWLIIETPYAIFSPLLLAVQSGNGKGTYEFCRLLSHI